MIEWDSESSMALATGASRGSIRDFIVEFLGGLVPGIAFLCAMIPAFLLPITTAVLSLFGREHLVFPNVDLPTSVGTILFLIIPGIVAFLVFAYIAGHLFYRQDPKIADLASFQRIPRHIHHDGMCRPVRGGDTLVEFPYHFLKQYLLDRGIYYLANRVPWDENNFKRRAKHFANALKIRIQIEQPAKFAIIARNEAHIRLSSSMWYVCKVLWWASWIGLGCYLLGYSFSKVIPHVSFAFSPVVMLPLLTASGAWIGRWAIERALHYQREREILFILETAHWLCISGRAKNIFDGLEPQHTQEP